MGRRRKAATERKAVRQDSTAYWGTGHQRWQEPPIEGQDREEEVEVAFVEEGTGEGQVAGEDGSTWHVN